MRPYRAKAHFERQGDVGLLLVSGDWSSVQLPEPPSPLQMAVGAGLARLDVDGNALHASDVRLAAWLWPVLQAARANGADVVLQNVPDGIRSGLEMALAQTEQVAKGSANTASPVSPNQDGLHASAGETGWMAQLGLSATRAWHQRQQTLTFIGQVMLAATATLGRGVQPGIRSTFRASDLASQLEQVGPRSLPIVLLVSALVGLILAYMGGAQLELFGAQSFVAPLVSVGQVREIAALVVGIVLAGRVGAAYAAQLATMRASEEIDALRTLGVDPVDHLVLPRLLALVMAAPLLTAMSAVCGALAGGAVAVGIYGVAPQDYLVRSLDALSLTHVAVGLFKGLLYGLLVGLAGCRQGLHAERSAVGVGRATTDAVVQALVWVSIAAATTTVVFHQLDW